MTKACETTFKPLLHSCVPAMVEAWAHGTPDSVAIVAPGRDPLTYGRLRTHLEDVAHTLHSLGIGRNDRIALVLHNGPEMAVAFLATAVAATCAPINPDSRASKLDLCLSDLRPKALMVQSGSDSLAIAGHKNAEFRPHAIARI